MKPILFILLLFCSSQVFSQDLLCDRMDIEGESTMKLTYENDVPMAVALRSPGENQFRPMKMDVNPITNNTKLGIETISVTPQIGSADVDWSKVKTCYAEVGSQWYFTFNHLAGVYNVTIYPYFVKKTQSCMEPRFTPQVHPLACGPDGVAI